MRKKATENNCKLNKSQNNLKILQKKNNKNQLTVPGLINLAMVSLTTTPVFLRI